MCTLHGECQKLSQIQLRPFYCSEIRRVGAQLLEEAVESVCRDLLQPEEGSTQSTLVLNTLSWERTEVISRRFSLGRALEQNLSAFQLW